MSLANSFHCILTGLQPYYYMENRNAAIENVLRGEPPWVDPRYRTSRSFIERRMVEIMERMWQYESEDRASIFEVVSFLRETAQMAGVEASGKWR